MDYNVESTERFIQNECDANEAACYAVAIINGLTQEQADNCDSGKWNCCGCPWGGSEAIRIAYTTMRE